MTSLPDETLAAALLDSRTRWRDLALMAADLLFETGADGRIVFLAPDMVLGGPAARLIGMPARDLLGGADAADPFRAASPPNGLRIWVTDAEGEPACLELAAMATPAGGLRGIARDVTREERQAESTGRLLRRATALVRLLSLAERSRGDAGAAAPARERLLSGICCALGCRGAALVAQGAAGMAIAAAHGSCGESLPEAGEGAAVPAAPGLALVAWRDAPLEAEEIELLAVLAPPLAGLHAEAERQRDLARAARTDPLTGLLNRRGFAEALEDSRARHPTGVIAYFDMDGLKRLNDRHGHAAGDEAIRTIAARLAAALRPGESAARLGGDEFALWLPRTTLAVARQRCVAIGAPGPLPGCPAAGAEAVTASVGLAAVAADDTAEQLLARADAAMYEVKRARRAA